MVFEKRELCSHKIRQKFMTGIEKNFVAFYVSLSVFKIGFDSVSLFGGSQFELFYSRSRKWDFLSVVR